MGVKVKHVIGDNTLNVQILTENPGGPFPKKIYANSMCTNDDPLIYTPLIKAYIVIIMMDDDCNVGHCECSNCKNSINIFDKYCCHCGARLIDRKVLGEDYEENSSIHISR